MRHCACGVDLEYAEPSITTCYGCRSMLSGQQAAVVSELSDKNDEHLEQIWGVWLDGYGWASSINVDGKKPEWVSSYQKTLEWIGKLGIPTFRYSIRNARNDMVPGRTRILNNP